MTNPTHQLQATLNTLQTLTHRYPQWRRWITDNLPDGYPTGNDGTGGSTNISNPTLNTTLARQQLHTLLTDAARTIQQLHNLTNRLHNLTQQGPKHTDHTGQRCTGTIDPTCNNLADGRRHKTGLCDQCWQRQYRQQRNTETPTKSHKTTPKNGSIR
jgi:5-methylcytosine-specific restriction endonuclease McrA